VVPLSGANVFLFPVNATRAHTLFSRFVVASLEIAGPSDARFFLFPGTLARPSLALHRRIKTLWGVQSHSGVFFFSVALPRPRKTRFFPYSFRSVARCWWEKSPHALFSPQPRSPPETAFCRFFFLPLTLWPAMCSFFFFFFSNRPPAPVLRRAAFVLTAWASSLLFLFYSCSSRPNDPVPRRPHRVRLPDLTNSPFVGGPLFSFFFRFWFSTFFLSGCPGGCVFFCFLQLPAPR